MVAYKTPCIQISLFFSFQLWLSLQHTHTDLLPLMLMPGGVFVSGPSVPKSLYTCPIPLLTSQLKYHLSDHPI